jgi:glycerol-3-phosphate acyltransferase PlsX
MAGAVLAQGAFKALKAKGSYETYGGSPLLGVNGVVIIAHGSSTGVAVKNAIRVAVEAVEHKINPRIEEAMSTISTAAPVSEI